MSLGEESRAGCEVTALCSQAEPSAGGGAERELGCAAGGAGQSLGARRRMGGVGGWWKQVTQTQSEALTQAQGERGGSLLLSGTPQFPLREPGALAHPALTCAQRRTGKAGGA